MLASNPMWHEADHQRLQASKIVTSGTWAARPGSPAPGQAYIATDRAPDGKQLLVFWDTGTSQWLETVEKTKALTLNAANAFPVAAPQTALVVIRGGLPHSTIKIYADRVVIWFIVPTTLNSSNTWTLTLNSRNLAGTLAAIGSAVALRTLAAAGAWAAATFPIGAIYDPASTSGFAITATSTGSPGTLGLEPADLHYRLVG